MTQPFTIVFALLFGLIAQRSFSQKLTISGTVRDAMSGELLIGASVNDSISGTGVHTNAYGFFSLEVPSPDHYLRVGYVGYLPVYVKDLSKLIVPV